MVTALCASRQVNLELERSGDDLHMHFPITIATVPFRIPNSNQQPSIHYGRCRDRTVPSAGTERSLVEGQNGPGTGTERTWDGTERTWD